MRITKYKVPLKLTRNASGQVDHKMDIDNKVSMSKGQAMDYNGKDVITLSKKVSDENNKQLSIALRTMLPTETERETFIIQEYIEE